LEAFLYKVVKLAKCILYNHIGREQWTPPSSEINQWQQLLVVKKFAVCLFDASCLGTQSPPIQHTLVLPSPVGISKALNYKLQTNSKKSSTIIIKTERRGSEPSGSNPNPQRSILGS